MPRSRRFPHLTRAVSPVAMRALGLGVVALLALPGPAQASLIAPKSGGSPNADRIHTLYMVVLVVGIVITVAVMGALFYALWKFRAGPNRTDADAEQLHGNTRLEIGWTAGAAVIVLILGVVTFAMLPGIRTPDNSDSDGWQIPASYKTAKDPGLLPDDGRSLNIEVNGQQYAWRFVYPDGDQDRQNNIYTYEQLVVPTGTTVTLDIRSSDVGHAWWIPELGGKMDALPGYTNHTWFKIPRGKEGVYQGQCAELCGRNHANMTAQVKAVTPEEFTAWQTRQRQAIATAATDAQAFRAEQTKNDEEQEQGTAPSTESTGASTASGTQR